MRERSDGDLVREAVAGSSEAFGALVTRYMRPGYLVAFSVTGNREDAEDVAQEAFLVALERLEECRNPERFGGWFLTIVRNRSKNLLRRETLRSGDEIAEEITPGVESPEADLDRAEIRRRLERSLQGLSGTRRQVLLLHDLEGWKHREIAEKLGLPEGTTRSHLHFARKYVREQMPGLGRVEQPGETT